jgi:hypothetical protein
VALQDDGHGNADAHRSDQLEKRITQLEAMLVLSKDQLQACRSIPIVPVSILRCHACSGPEASPGADVAGSAHESAFTLNP